MTLSQRQWRVGGTPRRNLYAQIGPEPSDEDAYLGMMETANLAAHVVAVHNASLGLAQPQRTGLFRLLGR